MWTDAAVSWGLGIRLEKENNDSGAGNHKKIRKQNDTNGEAYSCVNLTFHRIRAHLKSFVRVAIQDNCNCYWQCSDEWNTFKHVKH